jgi:CubicO group peptidase (beta-lactamase class C family)
MEAQQIPLSEGALMVERSIEGGDWKRLPTRSMEALRDGKIVVPFLDRRQEFRLAFEMRSTTSPALPLPTGRSDDKGTFFVLEELNSNGKWRPLSSTSLMSREDGFEIPLKKGKAIWRLNVQTIPPDPSPEPPLVINANPESRLGNHPKPIPVPGGGPVGSFAENPNVKPVPEPGPDAFNQYIFEERMHTLFEGDVKGYAVVVGNEDGFQARVAGGWARDPLEAVNPGLRMATFRPGNIGSSAKLYSGVALMRLLAEMGPDLDTNLDLPIAPFLPARWQDQLSDAHNNITFRMILNHTSGIRDVGTGSMPENRKSHPDYYFFSTPLTGTQGCNRYANENYRIMTYLIPRLAEPEVVEDWEDLYEDLDFEEYLDEMRDLHGLAFEEYMREEFFPLVEGSFAPTGSPGDDYPEGTTALMYDSPNDTAGLQWSQKELNGFWRAQGGFWSSAQELARFMSSVRYTDDLLEQADADLLISAPGTVGGACPGSSPWLITNGATVHQGFQNEQLGVSSWRDKPGRFDSGIEPFGACRAEAMFLPYDWVCAIVMNSDTLSDPDSSQGLTTPAVLDAFFDATRDVPVTISREAMSMTKFLAASDELSSRGMEVKWLDLHDIDGVPYVNAIFGDAKAPVAGLVGMNEFEYLDFINDWVTNKGFAVQQVESFLDGGLLRYAAMITEEVRPQQALYHGASIAKHDHDFNMLKNQGFVPVNVSVVSFNGELRYTALYEKLGVQFKLHSQLTPQDYQTKYTELYSDGYRLASLNAYRHGGEIYYAGVWHKGGGSEGAVHQANRDQYRSAEAQQFQIGREPAILTGVDSGDQSAPDYERHTFGSAWK